LPAWCALKGLGRAGYRDLVERCVDLAAAFAAWVEATPGFDLMNRERMQRTPFNIVCFRAVDQRLTDADEDDLNQALMNWVNADGRVFISRTRWEGRTALRVAVVNWSTSLADIALLQDAILDARAGVSSRKGTE
jgi:glutamate/tyrosine decarboxylase-like PLP-dependent enzyme